ncbi:alpha/beta fold hydrolase [Nocardioides sp. R-C-SC26]|uniref:alpha/beta fold hydrolase n=1 Tax=Nocardioides sp. R-C-SC26 TaxID=2870414 RepID=UPI001E560106|nr:alpha/beta hydrolase [Nocardioides sp. R-C-SC26]
MPEIETNGVTLHYTDEGQGRPVVLIHGWPLNGRSWSGQTSALVDAGYRVIAYDRRGFGESDKPADGYDYDTFSDDLAGIIDGLELDDVTLVGFSMGGGEVVRYLHAHGATRVRSAVLAAAVPPFLLKSDDNPEGGLTQDDVQEFLDGLNEDRESFLDDFTTEFFSVDGELAVSADERAEALALQRPARDEALTGCVRAFATTDFRADVAAISVPTLVIHGDSDATVPFEVSGKRSAEAIASSRLVVVESAPHGLNVSHREEFNNALLQFIAD